MARIVHFEIHVDDPDRASKFYSSIFGWEFSKWGDSEPEYWLVKTGEKDQPGIDGGMMRQRDPAGSVYNTIQVENIDESMGRVANGGGEIVVPKMPIPNVGWLCYFKDTEGNVFGIMEPDSEAK